MAARPFLALSVIFLTCATRLSAVEPAAPNPAATAKEVDRLLAADVPTSSPPAPIVDDQTFLRRAHLDILGEIPKPSEVTTFLLDPATDKRAKLVEKLLADPRYGRNWGRYFRDVVMYRKTEDRAFLIQGSMQEYLIKSFSENKPWNQIATDMITASGDAMEKGECGLIVSAGAAGRSGGRGQPHFHGSADSMCPVPRSSVGSLEAGAVS